MFHPALRLLKKPLKKKNKNTDAVVQQSVGLWVSAQRQVALRFSDVFFDQLHKTLTGILKKKKTEGGKTSSRRRTVPPEASEGDIFNLTFERDEANIQ